MDTSSIEQSLKVIEAELAKIREQVGRAEPRKTAYGPDYKGFWE